MPDIYIKVVQQKRWSKYGYMLTTAELSGVQSFIVLSFLIFLYAWKCFK